MKEENGDDDEDGSEMKTSAKEVGGVGGFSLAEVPSIETARHIGLERNPNLCVDASQELGFRVAWARGYRARKAATAVKLFDVKATRAMNPKEVSSDVSLEFSADEKRTWFSGFRIELTDNKRRIIRCVASVWRAAHCCDYYITKYASKSMQTLRPIFEQYAYGVRRLEKEEEEAENAAAADNPEQADALSAGTADKQKCPTATGEAPLDDTRGGSDSCDACWKVPLSHLIGCA